MTPTVSVVIATLNRIHYLSEALKSALSQTFTDFEVLVCDDGGKEETKAVCEAFHDERIVHIVNERPLGAAMNSLSGIMHARSDLIAFLNDDDRWTPEFLAKTANPLLQDPGAVLVFSDHWIIDAGGTRLNLETDRNSSRWGRDTLGAGVVSNCPELLARNSIPLAMAAVFRRSAVDWNQYSSNVGGTYDYFLSYCLLRNGGKVVYVPERLTEYRVHGGSASAEFNTANTKASAYVNGLILRDPKFISIRGDIRARCVGLEKHLVAAFLRKFELLPAMRHCYRWARYRLGREVQGNAHA